MFSIFTIFPVLPVEVWRDLRILLRKFQDVFVQGDFHSITVLFAMWTITDLAKPFDVLVTDLDMFAIDRQPLWDWSRHFHSHRVVSSSIGTFWIMGISKSFFFNVGSQLTPVTKGIFNCSFWNPVLAAIDQDVCFCFWVYLFLFSFFISFVTSFIWESGDICIWDGTSQKSVSQIKRVNTLPSIIWIAQSLAN